MTSRRAAGTGASAGRPAIRTLVARALLLRCPWCGERSVRQNYFDYKASCPQCAVRFNRGEQDYWIGGFMLNFVVGELIAIAVFLAAIVITWPDVPWTLVLYGSIVPAVLGPALSYPFSRNIWFALDLRFRPPERHDFAVPQVVAAAPLA